MPIISIIDKTGVISKTICEWNLFIRQMLVDTINFSYFNIGGAGVVVEVDETVIG